MNSEFMLIIPQGKKSNSKTGLGSTTWFPKLEFRSLVRSKFRHCVSETFWRDRGNVILCMFRLKFQNCTGSTLINHRLGRVSNPVNHVPGGFAEVLCWVWWVARVASFATLFSMESCLWMMYIVPTSVIVVPFAYYAYKLGIRACVKIAHGTYLLQHTKGF